MITCQICNKDCKNYKSLSAHIRVHKISSEHYYRKFISTDDKCKICGNKTRFSSIVYGYKDTCSPHCAGLLGKDKRKQTCLEKYGAENPTQNSQIKQKISNTVKSAECQERTKATCRQKYGVDYVYQLPIKHITNAIKCHETRNKQADQFEKDHNCIRIGKLIHEYGQGWLAIKHILNIIQINGYTFIDNNDLIKIKNYKNYQSKPEEDLYNFIKTFYNNKIIRHSRSIIKPYELDIYLPDIKLAVEYNSNWYHSIEYGTNKDYHLNKSVLCRKQNIRLIHIYEFENIDEQKMLLKNLILGKDNYIKDDFNKNNFTKIPNPELIYISDRKYHIYGAGKLYNKEEIK